MYHSVDELPLPGSASSLLDWASDQRWRWGATNAQRGKREVWGGEGVRGESQQGWAKMEEMVKIEMTAWT